MSKRELIFRCFLLAYLFVLPSFVLGQDLKIFPGTPALTPNPIKYNESLTGYCLVTCADGFFFNVWIRAVLSQDQNYGGSDISIRLWNTGTVSSPTYNEYFWYDVPADFSWGPGTYYVIVFIDPDNDHSESNESNNKLILPLTIQSDKYTLSTSVNPSGAGTVTKNPDQADYEEDYIVELTANANSGYNFDHWSGDLSGSTNPESITMTGNKSVTAVFAASTESITTPDEPSGPSTGKVGTSLSYSTGGSSSSKGHTVEYRFEWGDGQTSDWGSSSRSYIYASPDSYDIRARARCATHTSNTSSWSSSLAISISGHTLDVTVQGSGSVTTDPEKTEYDHEEEVQLTADPGSGYVFMGWQGDLSGTNPDTALTMDDDKSVTATFNAEGDTSGLSIQLEVETTTIHGTPTFIHASVTAPAGVASVRLHYRKGGDSVFDSTAMSFDGYKYGGTIPADFVTERGLEYYASAQDSTGARSSDPLFNPQDEPYPIQVTFSSLDCPQMTRGAAYQMVSVPAVLDNTTPNSVLVDDLGGYDINEWRLFDVYAGTTYAEFVSQPIGNFTPGNGFWLITRTSKSWDVGSGQSMPFDEAYSVQLDPGWNIFGHPLAFSVDWTDVVTLNTDIQSGNIENQLVGYGSAGGSTYGYLSETQLEPWTGYLLKNLESSPISILVPPVASVSSQQMKKQSHPAVRSDTDWNLRIEASCGGWSDCNNVIGQSENAQTGWDRYDLSEPPLLSDHVSLYFLHHDWDTNPGRYTSDIRPSKKDEETWIFHVRSSVEQGLVDLVFEGIESLPEKMNVVLLDKESQILRNIQDCPEYHFIFKPEESSRQFELFVSRSDSVFHVVDEFGPSPNGYELFHNFPNPFNASTTIAYNLPFDTKVELSICDLQGRLVRVLEPGLMKSAGTHTMEWDGTDNRGSFVTSGMYIVVLRYGSVLLQQKLIFTK